MSKIKTIRKNAATSSFHQNTAPVIVEASKQKDTRYHSDSGLKDFLGWK